MQTSIEPDSTTVISGEIATFRVAVRNTSDVALAVRSASRPLIKSELLDASGHRVDHGITTPATGGARLEAGGVYERMVEISLAGVEPGTYRLRAGFLDTTPHLSAAETVVFVEPR